MSAHKLSAYLLSILDKASSRLFQPPSGQAHIAAAQLPLLPLGAVMNLDEEEDPFNDVDLDGLQDIQGGYTPYLGKLTAVACLGGLQFGWVRRIRVCLFDLLTDCASFLSARRTLALRQACSSPFTKT